MRLLAVIISALMVIVNCHATGVRTKMVCEYETLSLNCLEDQRLDIKYVEFGRQNAIYCNTNNQWTSRVTNCTSKAASYSAVAKRCQHKKACTVPAHYGVLGDPCDYVQKYLEIGYECVTGDLRSQSICDNQSMTISCSNSKKIVINEATYGRTNPITCNRPGTIINTNLCSSANATAIITKACDEQTTCSVKAAISVFGDPCPNVSKFLEVKYSCQ